MTTPQMETIVRAIRVHHSTGQDARIFAPDAMALAKDLRVVLPECEIGFIETVPGRCLAVVGRPKSAWVLPEDLRALSLTVPWGWLVARGIKPIENRPDGFSYKGFRGPFLIHSAKTCSRPAYASTLRMIRAIGGDDVGDRIPAYDRIERSGIIGIGRIVDIIPPGESGRKWHFPEQWGFVVIDARPLPLIPCSGFQGFWRVPPAVRTAVEKELAT